MLAALKRTPALLARPAWVLRSYRGANLGPDLVSGLTVAVVLLPQALVFSLLAGLPPERGLYAAVAAAIAGALWGASNHLHTGPTNTASVLVLSTLAPVVQPGSGEYAAAAALLAIMAGLVRVALGAARLGILVNFVSDSVIVGFTAGAGVLIFIGELRHLLRIGALSAPGIVETLRNIGANLPQAHLPSLALGLGTLALIVLLRRVDRRLPGPLIAVVVASALVALVGAQRLDVHTLGPLPTGLPPLISLEALDMGLVREIATGALAVAAIGLVEATSIARSIAVQSGQRLDTNQEFVGQGVANIAAGLFSGYPCSGSFNRSALNYEAGARTPLAAAFSGLVVLLAMLFLGPLTAFLPRASLAGMLVLAAWGMVDRRQMRRIWRGARGEALIMLVTLFATLFLPLQFAVLAGILMSFAYYIMKTSTPQVRPVLPDDDFRHLVHRPERPHCPQLGILDVHGDLYFGAVGHVEDAIRRYRAEHPTQRFLLLRMQSVDLIDISGIRMLESVLRLYYEVGGDVYLTRVNEPVLRVMRATGFLQRLGEGHVLHEDYAIEYLFHKVLDPAVCIYESGVRVFRECQNLPRPDYVVSIPLTPVNPADLREIAPRWLWERLREPEAPLVVDVREPREYARGHIPRARLMPLSTLLAGPPKDLPHGPTVVLVCRSGRRSARAAAALRSYGFENVAILRGGMLAWEAANLLQAVD
ncbi:MAG TPA: SulP family inorganic anion transporter [Roseiflexaceae bacterium]|nr:SulP family inorganic anion transporter [Roseiflexaceae bacterium]